MHVTNKRWNEVWKCEMENVMVWGRFWYSRMSAGNNVSKSTQWVNGELEQSCKHIQYSTWFNISHISYIIWSFCIERNALSADIQVICNFAKTVNFSVDIYLAGIFRRPHRDVSSQQPSQSKKDQTSWTRVLYIHLSRHLSGYSSIPLPFLPAPCKSSLPAASVDLQESEVAELKMKQQILLITITINPTLKLRSDLYITYA